MKLCHLPVHGNTCGHTEVFQREGALVVGQTVLLEDGVLGVAVNSDKLLIGNLQEVEYRECANILHHVGVVTLAVATRIIIVGVARHLVAEIVTCVDLRHGQVDTVLPEPRQVVVIIVECRLGLRNEVGPRDRAVLVLLDVEVWQYRQCTDAGVAKVGAVVNLNILGSVSDVLHDDGVSGRARAAEDARHDEDAVVLLKHV